MRHPPIGLLAIRDRTAPVVHAVHALLRSHARRALDALGRNLLPPRCLVCGERGEVATGQPRATLDLCAACAAQLPWNQPACPGCALPMPSSALRCGACLRRPPAYHRCVAAFRYEPPLDRLLPRLKYHGDLAAGALLSALLLQRLHASEAGAALPGPLEPLPEALVPVPLHRARLASRGYNQALELARPLAAALQLPLLPRLLQRRRATVAQTTLDARARRSNVQGAFAVQPGAVVPRHVALLDDTMTTGSTVAECARVLRAAGVERVDAWVVARAP